MSGLVFKLRALLTERIDLTDIVPNTLAGLSLHDVQRLSVGTGRSKADIGDLFFVSGSTDERLVIEGGSSAIDGIGSGLGAGTIIVEGDAGSLTACGMRGGRLEIAGNTGSHLASGMRGGIVVVKGSAGGRVGAARAGERFGMAGGTVVIGGDAGDRAGDRMQRGTIVVRGRCGAATGSRMMGGTILAEGGFGDGPGPLLRRGTLIGPSVERLLSTFADCGHHDPVVLRLINRHLASILGDLGDLAPKPLPLEVRRFAGDLATIGKGELLLTG